MKNTVSLLSAKDMRRSILAGFINAGSVVCGILSFFYIVSMLDLLFQRQPFSAIISQCAMVAILLMTKSILYGFGMAITHKVAYSALADIRSRLIVHMECLSLSDIEKRKTGEFAHIVDHEVEQVELFLAHALPELLVAVIIPVAIIIFMYNVFWQFALIYFLQISLLIIYMMWYMKNYSPKFDEYAKCTGRMGADLMEYIAGIRVIKVFNTGKGKTLQVLERMRDYISWAKQVIRIIIFPKSMHNLIIALGVFFTAVVGTQQLIRGTIDLKTCIMGLIFAGFLGESLSNLLLYTFNVMKFNASRKAIISVLSIPAATREIALTSGTPGDIEFSSVSFAYTDVPIVDNVSFDIRYNTTTALVGMSGSGKTTIGKMITGFLFPDTGTVTINGISTRVLSEQAIAQMVSYVQQEAFLFNMSIYENILLGNPAASEQEVFEAAKKAQIHTFIQSLPEGYNTLAGESGACLSGGEKQRIALARMILKDAPIIVLDEATASIDPQNEQLIKQAIEAVSAGKTRIVITHRLDTVREADAIIVVDSGRILDQGSHRELMTRCEHYRQMVNARHAAEQWTIMEARS
ncbi:Putative multidrug export ATP-binding/permease protein [Sporomusa ovata DSM 2662]|uniref:ABC transporter, ATP-binding/permease protein n=1 Tax=Sporomusa ovata TaxID=2378 RepID=A0A0U1KSS6_9FIRM|nr:ATP-binding cassette domain-containing protein [Sporomusa ovata]EQB24969.1 ABC-type multidrug transport system, ATPase and permease component [Sporomusa ovata DSM 2662]CQR70169.1 ABC transporter, ATP-binding/permease protein [Sporomusa ovata]